VDNYFWLRDRADPDVIPYLEAENRYTEEVMSPTKPLQEALYHEILGRIQETDVSVPVKRDDYFYYTRTEEGKAYSIQCRKHGLDASEEILLDSNALAEGQKYFRLGNFAVSPDHRLLAYSVDLEGDESYTIQVKDLSTGQLLPDRIVNTYYTLEWLTTTAPSSIQFSTKPNGLIGRFVMNSALRRMHWFIKRTTGVSTWASGRRAASDLCSSRYRVRSPPSCATWKP
jgi:protease II